jgi:general secretion pathway protein M
MKAWWMQLAKREQRLVAFGAAVLAGGLIYALIWHPLARGIAGNEARVAQQRADLAWMQQAALQMRGLRSQPGGTSSPVTAGQPLGAVLQAALRAQGLDSAVDERAPGEDGSIRLTFKRVPFDALLRCLAGLQAAGVKVQSLDLERAGAGQVLGAVQVMWHASG